MEKLQLHSGDSQSILGHSKTLITIIASGLIGACSTPPERGSTTQYIPVYREPIYVPVYKQPEPVLISKMHTSNGPLGDKICKYIFNTQENVSELCSTKDPEVVRSYSKVIPASTVTIPGKTITIPGKTEYGYGYGIGIDGKYGYGYRLQNTPPKTEYTMPKIESRPAKTVSCRVIKPFDQKDGSQLPTREFCN